MKRKSIANVMFVSSLMAATVFTQALAQTQTEPLGGQPAPGAKPSVDDLAAQVAYQRAFEAVVWAAPAVAIYRFRMGAFSSVGADDNVILACSLVATPKIEILTANNAIPYVAAFSDLRKGPVVLEVPAKTDKAVLYGQVVDAWQTSIADVGPEGLDQGKGAKLLFLPPGYKEAIPAGYLPVQSTGYRIAFAFRSVHSPGATDADSYAYSKTLKMYYLSQAANPPPQKFVDPSLPSVQRFPTLPFYDIRDLNDIHDIVSVEPVQPRDKVMMGMLASLGIEKGKPFNPQGTLKAAMERGVVDAYFYLEEEAYKIYSANLFWPNRHWSSTFQPDSTDGFGYVTDDAILLDARGMQFFIGTYYPEKYAYGSAANVYAGAIADSKGNRLAPGKNYRLRVPKDVPVREFWSVTVYDMATWAFIYSPLERPGLSSFDKSKMKVNADGSVDLYMGPTAPAGLESNWIPTSGKRPYPIFRFYGADKAVWDKTFVLPDFEEVP